MPFPGPFRDHFWLHFGVIWGHFWSGFSSLFGVVSESWFEVGFHWGFLPEPLFKNHFRDLFQVFSIVFSFASVVEAAPQARPKTTAVANTALRPSPCSPPSLNALPVPLLRQVFLKVQNRAPMQVKLTFSPKHRKIRNQQWRFTCMAANFSTRIELPCR